MFCQSRISVAACAVTASVLWNAEVVAGSSTSLTVTTLDTEAPVALTLQDLDAMPQVSFTTTTIWTDGEVTFSGVSLKAVLGDAARAGSTLEMTALNDYKVTMPVDDLEDGAPIVATRMDGQVMSVRDKGPFWVVFPYDSDAKYRSETVHARSIWQLNRLKVVD